MAFKGAIKAGKTVVATLRLDHSSSGEALVFMAAGSADGASSSGRAVVVPGGEGAITLVPEQEGILEIEVDMTDEDDTGQLIVTVNGKKRTSEKITGDTSWTYAIT
ncbi:MAG: hypothetical protein K8S21_04370 [Gemmatimonadetes bacterium]|nr:hypothetical protein [Gemmatimonadota bacterium]